MPLLKAATKEILKKAFTYISTILTVVTGVKNYRTIKKLKDQGQDILATKVADGGKIPIIYGRRRVGSTLLYMDTDSGNSKELFVVYGLCLGEVDAIELDTIEINGVPLSDTKVFRDGFYTGSDKISSGAGSLNTVTQIGDIQTSTTNGRSGDDPTKRYRMVFNAHHGADDQTVDPMLNASQPARFGSNHRLRGIAYIAASFQFDTRGMFTSTPELTVVVKGRKLYDPRLDGSITGGTGSHRITDATTYEWSNNGALCLLDYMHQEYGKGLASASIDLQSFQTAANTADTVVDVPDYGGSYASATFTGILGNNFIEVDETTWKKVKGGELISVKDSSGSVVINQKAVIDTQRFKPHTESTQFRIGIGEDPPEKITKTATFSASNNDATITVTCSSHGASQDDRVLFAGAVSLGGNITATVLNKLYTITSVADANTFTFEATNLDGTEVKANSSDTGNGGGSVVAKFMYEDEGGSVLTQARRFPCDGVIDTNETVLENARELLSNIRGFLNYIDGKYSVLVEDTGSSSFSITEDHIIDEGIKIKYEDKANKLNKVVAKFFNAQKKFEPDTKFAVHNDNASTFTNDDGGEELEQVIELPFITNPYNAFNMAKAIIGRSRNQKTISFIGTPRLLNLTAGDVVDITYSPYNLSGNVYRVEAVDLLDNGLVNIQMLEYIDIYTWDAVPPTENVGALPDLPTGQEASKPTNLTFTDSTNVANNIKRPFLSWTAATDYPAKKFHVNIVDSAGNELLDRNTRREFMNLGFLPKGTNYVASVSSINARRAESDAATLTFTIADEPVQSADIAAAAFSSNTITGVNNTDGRIAISGLTGGVGLATINLANDLDSLGQVSVTELKNSTVSSNTNIKINPAANTIFEVNGSEKARFDNNGRLGIGQSSPATLLHLEDATDPTITMKDTTNNCTFEVLASNSSAIIGTSSDHRILFKVNDTERMRLTAQHLLLGTTSTTIDSSNFGILLNRSNGRIKNAIDVGGSGNVTQMFGNAGEFRVKGDGDVQNTNNSYGGISDQNLKENIVDATNKLDDINQVQIRNFNFIGSDHKQIGVIAQELESVFPSLVKTDDEGLKSVKYSVLVPILVKALQEADDKIDALTARVEALEGN